MHNNNGKMSCRRGQRRERRESLKLAFFWLCLFCFLSLISDIPVVIGFSSWIQTSSTRIPRLPIVVQRERQRSQPESQETKKQGVLDEVRRPVKEQLASRLATVVTSFSPSKTNLQTSNQLPFFVDKKKEKLRPATALSNSQPNPVVMPLLEIASLPQSNSNRKAIEELIHELYVQAQRNPKQLLKPITLASTSSARMVWSTVTANSVLGTLFQRRPCDVLGGPSWQVIATPTSRNPNHGEVPSRTMNVIGRAENIVFWKSLDLRMVGQARLLASSSSQEQEKQQSSLLQLPQLGSINSKRSELNSYGVEICGLEFRWGGHGCPEQNPNNNLDKNVVETKSATLQESAPTSKAWQLFSLDESLTLGNGVGELQVWYNDGVVRITHDVVAKNTYIHIQEPMSTDLQTLFPLES